MDQKNHSSPSFRGWRSLLWPIYREEAAHVTRMIGILFLSCLVFGILRNMKDALVVTAEGGGAEVIPFLKVWGILPMAILATGTYTKLANWLSQERVYSIVIGGFILYFLLFAFVLYPYRDTLHPNAWADWAEASLPAGFRGFIAMFRNWTYTSLYVFAELWGSLILTVMFWNFANQVTEVEQAKRFYGTITIFSNFAAMTAGFIGRMLTLDTVQTWIPFGSDPWEQSQLLFLCVTVICCVAILILYRIAFRKSGLDQPEQRAQIRKKQRMSLTDGFACLKRSPYIGRIAIIVLSYNLVINLVETIWKDQLHSLYPNPSDYNAYMANVTIAIGFVSCAVSVITGWIIRHFGWTFTALLTPLSMLITSAGFFGCLLTGNTTWASFFALLGTSPLALTVFFGGAHNSLSKAAKYSVFDATKEMTFIPLSTELKMQGKAAIDGVGSRLAKSGSSLLQQGLLLTCGSLIASAPVIAVVVFVTIFAWTRSVLRLGPEFTERSTASTDEEELDAQAV